jgi:hypothetical protein
MTLAELRSKLSGRWDGRPESLHVHLRELIELKLVTKESRTYMAVSPDRIRNFLSDLMAVTADLTSTSELLLAKHEEAEKYYTKFIVFDKRKQRRKKPAMSRRIDALFLDKSLASLNPFIVKKWLGRMAGPDVGYDFRKLHQA